MSRFLLTRRRRQISCVTDGNLERCRKAKIADGGRYFSVTSGRNRIAAVSLIFRVFHAAPRRRLSSFTSSKTLHDRILFVIRLAVFAQLTLDVELLGHQTTDSHE
ncbi:hypothetical protein AVEN_194547-1 [Araneus ventricosus]|uniref:Uncharacterized protein n=1 Tax=Araneus ventricosus TaxID=182803 RepID=A0A4Y2A7E4_ARAVE|nr:hypothetical protein AVEN_194547-1 [Araneus ventricosus]